MLCTLEVLSRRKTASFDLFLKINRIWTKLLLHCFTCHIEILNWSYSNLTRIHPVHLQLGFQCIIIETWWRHFFRVLRMFFIYIITIKYSHLPPFFDMIVMWVDAIIENVIKRKENWQKTNFGYLKKWLMKSWKKDE